MDFILLVVIILALFIFVGAFTAFVNRGKIETFRERLSFLESRVEAQRAQIEQLKDQLTAKGAKEEVSPVDKPASKQAPVTAPVRNQSIDSTRYLKQQSSFAQIQVKSAKPATRFDLDKLIKGNGLFWLGAIVLALGGIFLAKYAIEAGLVPPSVRVTLGALFGVTLLVVAEYANRNADKFNIHNAYFCAALASGGVVTCYAMAFVAFDFYSFITPNIAFVLLGFVALLATYLALRFGPLLAAIGLIGAYLVPALVSTGSNNVTALLIFIGIVSASAVWVADAVKNTWLWWQSFIGHFVWLALAVAIADVNDIVTISMFLLASFYLFVFTNLLGWNLKQTFKEPLSIVALLMPRTEQAAVVAIFSLAMFYLWLHPNSLNTLSLSLVLFIVVTFAAIRHSALDSWHFLMLGFALFSFLQLPLPVSYQDYFFPFSGNYLYVQVAVVLGLGTCVAMLKVDKARVSYLLLMVLIPISFYGLSYIFAKPAAESTLYPIWALELLCIGAIASMAARRTDEKLHQVTYLVLANATLTLCLTMLLSASTLTIAIVAQVATMSYLSRKFNVAIPNWIYKVALLVVLTRLTMAPWLASYKAETILQLRWTVVVYPLVIALIWVASKYNPSTQLRPWFTGVLIHVLALLVTTETSYLLIGSYPDFAALSYHESILLSFNWLLLAVVYLYRATLTKSLSTLYQYGGALLIGGATLLQLDISLVHSPFLTNQHVGGGVINWLFLQWLLPAVVLYLLVRFKLVQPLFVKPIYCAVALLGVLFINGEIRALYHQGLIKLYTPIPQAELYTYSFVWLALSTAMIFLAQHKQHDWLRNAGFIGLAIVILKVFGIDMSNLEGLYRAFSFIGLGLCLVGIGWLFQKLQRTPIEQS
ncbi:DUF2339 domain-containing protein [Thalassotalea agarivorans]|uniref:Uncharacterized membrane protein n=1 Tax=Thalassotalea agarivorans TaxID=349064 RepID=A0A1I0CWG3_THASX|nr:DUF2339 domain-containing protein [Thalassotalea agarivorans]SET23991.1 Uncharacterized membrane protein [Thalassotalea agarivorans]